MVVKGRLGEFVYLDNFHSERYDDVITGTDLLHGDIARKNASIAPVVY